MILSIINALELNRQSEIKIQGTKIFSEKRIMLRDVDGLSNYIDEFILLKLILFFEASFWYKKILKANLSLEQI